MYTSKFLHTYTKHKKQWKSHKKHYHNMFDLWYLSIQAQVPHFSKSVIDLEKNFQSSFTMFLSRNGIQMPQIKLNIPFCALAILNKLIFYDIKSYCIKTHSNTLRRNANLQHLWKDISKTMEVGNLWSAEP